MKKAITFILLSAVLLLSFSGCAAPYDSEKINIVCTLFPQYDWIKNIVGDSDSVEVTLLIQNGTDPHSYQPTAADIMTISNCDMIVYIGSDSDIWVKEALERAKNTDTVKVALSELDGMTLHEISSSSHSHDHSEHEHEHHGAFDEHLWLSLRNAAMATSHLTQALCAIDERNAEAYRSNAEEYIRQLNSLDEEYRAVADSTDTHDRFMLFADRFPFVYLLSDYGIEYSAAFEGCTTDVDAGFDTVLELIKEADEHSVSYIAVTETSDRALAKTVAASAKNDINILVMDSLQSVTKKQLSEGISYISVMKKNLVSLSVALGAKGE